MPRFFFDLHNGHWERDDVGADLIDIGEAILQAKRTLPAMALDQLPQDGDRQIVIVLVIDEDGRPVYTATLAYTGLVLAR